MRDPQQPEPAPTQLLQQVHELPRDRPIERAGRLVGEQQHRLGRQGPREADPLALTAAQRARQAARNRGIERDATEQRPECPRHQSASAADPRAPAPRPAARRPSGAESRAAPASCQHSCAQRRSGCQARAGAPTSSQPAKSSEPRRAGSRPSARNTADLPAPPKNRRAPPPRLVAAEGRAHAPPHDPRARSPTLACTKHLTFETCPSRQALHVPERPQRVRAAGRSDQRLRDRMSRRGHHIRDVSGLDHHTPHRRRLPADRRVRKSARSCVTSTKAIARSLQVVNSASSSCACARLSSDAVGSSTSNTAGRHASASASATRCACPPLTRADDEDDQAASRPTRVGKIPASPQSSHASSAPRSWASDPTRRNTRLAAAACGSRVNTRPAVAPARRYPQKRDRR